MQLYFSICNKRVPNSVHIIRIIGATPVVAVPLHGGTVVEMVVGAVVGVVGSSVGIIVVGCNAYL